MFPLLDQQHIQMDLVIGRIYFIVSCTVIYQLQVNYLTLNVLSLSSSRGRPGLFSPKERAKWDAWKAVEGLLCSFFLLNLMYIFIKQVPL